MLTSGSCSGSLPGREMCLVSGFGQLLGQSLGQSMAHRSVMVIQAQPIEFDDEDPRPMLAHLDRWAGSELATPEQWADVAQRAGQWADYSPRNQVLLASYGVVGRVAGEATWAQVPSVEEGRAVAVRAGEHALVVRVPIVGDAAAARSSRMARVGVSESVASGFGWEPVFAAEQLARRPHPDAVAPIPVPPMSDNEWSETVRAASAAIVGKRPRSVHNPGSQLRDLAAAVPLRANRAALPAVVAEQVGWLVADRAGRAEGPMPSFDPSGLAPRERWRLLEDTRLVTDRLSTAISGVMGVDLSASPLPRWSASDDREVAPERRNYLSRAEVGGLPPGVWSEVGPYTSVEWSARGREDAVGRAAFLRATPRSYLAVYETSGGARWALETAGRGPHLGLVAEGEAPSFVAARADARSALRDRFPEVARTVDASLAAPVLSPTSGWVALDNGRDDRTMQRTFDDQVGAVIAPGPGGRWETWTSVDGTLTQAADLAPTAADAQAQAEGLAYQALVGRAATNPAIADRLVAEAADSPTTWDRSLLNSVVGPALTDADADRLVDPAATALELVELLANSGRVGPSTIVAVLHAEGVDTATVAGLAHDIGLPVATAIHEIATRWERPRPEVGELLSATREELRDAGATVTELLAHSPAATLRTLDMRPETWERLGPTLMESGFDAVTALRHVADHAPSAETMAVAAVSIVDASDFPSGQDPADVVLAVIGRRVTPADLAAVTEVFGLNPADAAIALRQAGVPEAETIHTVVERVDGDHTAARGILTDTLDIDSATFDRAMAPAIDNVISFRPIEAPSANADLLNALAELDQDPVQPETITVADTHIDHLRRSVEID